MSVFEDMPHEPIFDRVEEALLRASMVTGAVVECCNLSLRRLSLSGECYRCVVEFAEAPDNIDTFCRELNEGLSEVDLRYKVEPRGATLRLVIIWRR